MLGDSGGALKPPRLLLKGFKDWLLDMISTKLSVQQDNVVDDITGNVSRTDISTSFSLRIKILKPLFQRLWLLFYHLVKTLYGDQTTTIEL